MRFLPAALALALLLPAAAFAQSLGDSSLGEIPPSFSVSATPQYPAPRGKAVLSFLSSSLDLANATLAVSANGKSVYQGSVQPVAVALGSAGSVTNVVATLTSNGASYRQTLRLQPQDVVLVAEPLSSVPPLYPGKSLVPLEGSVRVVAMANLKSADGKVLDPSTLSYTWTVDGVQTARSSGIGKMAIVVASPIQYRSSEVSVAVMSREGALVGGDSLSLISLEPSVRIYESDSLLGIRFDHALSGGYAITDAESTLYAAPFSFSTARGAPLLKWFLDGTEAQTGNAITLRPTGSGQGNASLSFVASAGEFMRATANLSLSFGAKPGTNLFGL
ncbi:hypothetical protein HY972_01100 [Candidatus Kaiserbacteria bacterium]|nr:hypothetical protein [Candidatus Kaiserbacteria bacterium]